MNLTVIILDFIQDIFLMKPGTPLAYKFKAGLRNEREAAQEPEFLQYRIAGADTRNLQKINDGKEIEVER